MLEFYKIDVGTLEFRTSTSSDRGCRQVYGIDLPLSVFTFSHCVAVWRYTACNSALHINSFETEAPSS